jgi:UDP-N-acetylmuramate--alanine ligase
MHDFLVPRMRHVEHVHFVGIGGAGMCGIAEMLHDEGYKVTGSDLTENASVKKLQFLGIKVFIGHAAENIVGANVVVRSTDVPLENIEFTKAREKNIPVIPRAVMLAELMRFRHGIAVSGTHGKTTTTSLVASMLSEGGIDPSYVIGGKLNSTGHNAKLGKSKYLVAEADESDASFLFLKPIISIVTNIDADHMSTYGGDFAVLRQTFIDFLRNLPFYGLAILCIDDETVTSLLQEVQRPIATYGFKDTADYMAYDWQQDTLVSNFKIRRAGLSRDLICQSKIPGRHNVQNVLAAVAVATELGVSDEAIISAIKDFEGVGRRFQLLGKCKFTHGSALVVDDYGHHPNEILATFKAVQAVWPNKRLIHVFQPHRYSRTQDLFADFVKVLIDGPECSIIFDIYSAGEKPIAGISSANLIVAMQQTGYDVTLVTQDDYIAKLNKIVREGDIVLMQGAGNISQYAANLMKEQYSLER